MSSCLPIGFPFSSKHRNYWDVPGVSPSPPPCPPLFPCFWSCPRPVFGPALPPQVVSVATTFLCLPVVTSLWPGVQAMGPGNDCFFSLSGGTLGYTGHFLWAGTPASQGSEGWGARPRGCGYLGDNPPRNWGTAAVWFVSEHGYMACEHRRTFPGTTVPSISALECEVIPPQG